MGGDDSEHAGAAPPARGTPVDGTWRNTLLNALTVTALTLATLAFPVLAILAITRARPRGLAVLGTLYLILVVATSVRRLPYLVRAWALLVVLGSVGVFGLMRVGFQLGPGLGCALLVVMSALLIGRRALILTFLFTTSAILGVGWFHAIEHVDWLAPGIADPTLANWMRAAVVYVFFTGILAAAVSFVVSHIERALEDRTRALARMQAAHQDRVKAEEALGDAQQTIAQMQKMEAIGRLAGGVAHDFNNQLVVILGWADLLRTTATDSNSLREGLDEIAAAGNRAASLTQQLLAFGRKAIVVPRAVAPADLLGELSRMLVRLLPANIELVKRVSDGLPMIFADPAQIHQALLNLCVNARDAMPDGGVLELCAQLCAPGDAPAGTVGPWVALSVRDTGIGMDEATQQRVFEPFFTTKGELGSGLGLASVYGSVKQNEGQLRLESEIGRGSTFTLTFRPHTLEPSLTRDGRTSEQAVGAGTAGAILVAEDEPAVRALIVHALSSAGHTVLAADSGGAALELARRYRGKFGLLCTDGMMPGMSSTTLIADFRQLFPEASVLVCSGHIERHVQSELPNARINYLHKPFTSEALTRAVREAIRPS
jgi:signal transduction histidine kinase/CheY-like chemotaxis protein